MRVIAPAERGTRAGGFTLIELLIVVAIIGIIAAIAVPNLLNAVDKAKQKKSMGDVRAIGSATEAYAVDISSYPKGVSTWTALRTVLNPYFINNPPDTDGWDNGWLAVTDAAGGRYTLTSLGKDGAAGPQTGGQTTDFNCDILFTQGQFWQWPQGTQS